MKIFEVKERMNGFSESRHPVKRCVIQVGPQNTRDTVINQLNDLNKIKLIEFQTMKILEELENFIVNKNLEDFEIKYSKFKKNHKWFLCRDFTKEGITKPRELLYSILKVFNELYPDMEAYQDIDFFNSFELIVDNEMKRPLRGHGLGMANSLTTLMQIIIFTMTKLKMEINTDAITLLTHNDDAIIGTQKSFEIEEYWEKEEEILVGLGLLRNPKKSFYGKNFGVFIERYFSKDIPTMNRKDSYQRRELMIAFAATNIVHAKQIVSSQVYLDKQYIQLKLEEIINYWGYEFFPEEVNYPAFCGGWYNEAIYGVSTDLRRLDELPYDSRVYRAYKACKDSRLKPKFKKGDYRSPVSKIFPLQCSFIEEPYRLIYDIGTRYDIESKYTSLKVNPELYIKAWERLKKDRRKIFLQNHSATFEDFIKEVTTSSNRDFIPLDFMVEKTIKTEAYQGRLEDPYQTSTPLLSYLSWLEPIQGIDRNPWGLIFSQSSSVSSRLTTTQRKRLKVVMNELSLAGKLTLDQVLIPEDEVENLELQGSYFSPYSFAKVYGEVENIWIPILKEEYRNPLIKRKELVYNRLLSKSEILLFHRFGKDKMLRDFIISKNTSYERITNLLQEIYEYQKEEVKEPIHSDSSSEELEYDADEERILYPLPSEFRKYLLMPSRAQGEIKERFDSINKLKSRMKMSLATDLPFERFTDLMEEWERLDPLSQYIWTSVWGNPKQESEEESEEEEVEFSLFDDG